MVKIKNEQELLQAHTQFQLVKNVASSQIKLLETVNTSGFISKTFSNLFSAYAQAFNKQQQHRGSLFMPNFKRKVIEDETYYAKLIFYIHNNPVHHGFVKA